MSHTRIVPPGPARGPVVCGRSGNQLCIYVLFKIIFTTPLQHQSLNARHAPRATGCRRVCRTRERDATMRSMCAVREREITTPIREARKAHERGIETQDERGREERAAKSEVVSRIARALTRIRSRIPTCAPRPPCIVACRARDPIARLSTTHAAPPPPSMWCRQKPPKPQQWRTSLLRSPAPDLIAAESLWSHSSASAMSAASRSLAASLSSPLSDMRSSVAASLALTCSRMRVVTASTPSSPTSATGASSMPREAAYSSNTSSPSVSGVGDDCWKAAT